ncbi:MAG: DUF4924 family protein [Bacteroidetes bacterium]|nr:DUF4924 family protein [Bacteroidota bacterium]
MLIADRKRKENISEYLVYMYQTEDLLRAYHFDIEDLRKNVIDHLPAEDQQAALAWYTELAQHMQAQGLEKAGHLQETQDTVKKLYNLHEQLLKADQQYRQIYSKTAVHIRNSMDASGGAVSNPVQAALNGVYGYLLLKLNGKPIDQDIMPAVNAFGDLLSYLSYRWREREH